MKRLLKTLVLSAAVAATTLTAFSTAQAGDWRYRDGGYRHHRGSDAAVAGIAGLAVGALAGAALAAPRERIIVDDGYYPAPPPPRRVYVEPRRYERAPQVVYSEGYRGGYGVEPWSRDWYNYCSDRYRSFNPNDGTFVGYDGVRRFCEAN